MNKLYFFSECVIPSIALAGMLCGLASLAGCSNYGSDPGPPVFERKGPANYDQEKLTPKQKKMIEKANIQRDS
ncbi:MAG: hypothetical protein ABS79_01810 [Planctomycetes bacterium SCN 63-9]|nr:MAG: hypothetical protein ABS79_01810 [Planctomycetes bacterium SCN 63-9]